MEILNLFWLLWLDGWTGQHWFSIVWTASTVGMVICYTAIAILRWRDRTKFRA